MKNNMIYRVCGIMLAVMVSHSMYGEKKSERHFHKSVQKYPLAICMFYLQDDVTNENPSLTEKINTMIQTFRDVNEQEGYQEAGLAFLEVNVANIDIEKHLSDLGINVKRAPGYALYIEGRPVAKKGQHAVLNGFASHDQLHQFINRYLSTEIKEARDAYEARKKERARRRLYYPYAPYYYPYPYYWRRPYYGGIGVGFGFGYHSGYGRYRRRHW